jgi:hypothetical protein
MLTPSQVDGLTTAVQDLRKPFRESFWDGVMVTILRHVFGPAVPPLTPEKSGVLRRDARQTLKQPLADADVVILRERFLVLILQGLGLEAADQQHTWTENDVDVALRGTLPAFGEVGCARNARHVQYLQGLVAYYADEALTSIITPNLARWVEQSGAAIQRDLRVDDEDTNLIQTHLYQMTHDEMRTQLLRPDHGEIGVPPQQIRQTPLHQEKPQQQQHQQPRHQQRR